MCMTDKFDPGDTRHRAMKKDPMQGIALRDIATTGEVNRALEAAEFQGIEAKDRAVDENGETTPWYKPKESWSNTLSSSLRGTPLGRKAIMAMSRLAEAMGMFPKGSTVGKGAMRGL